MEAGWIAIEQEEEEGGEANREGDRRPREGGVDGGGGGEGDGEGMERSQGGAGEGVGAVTD